ncbi:ALG6, ALG8 glycosyltransferase [Aureobasidium pullulans]|nr:ALG6, ALG8 glycosyltransferase [Aureobasidium pullulans]
MAPTSHRPRKKRRDDQVSGPRSNALIVTDAETKQQKPAFPLVAFLLPAKGTVSQWIVMPLILMAVGLFRWATGFWGYSGLQKPPMHGDFEAQRHWMELTINLPVSHWYFHDLQWWGLDYPPLTAYHSWALGKVGNFINPAWFALKSSRGLDDHDLKIFMRATVIVSEYLILVPAAVIFIRHMSKLCGITTWESSVALTAVLMQPATMLIDHGHFQYNTVMLGLMLASMSSMLAGRHLWSCVYFVAALGFKQMALFYAPAVFAYLLGICVFPRINIGRLLSIAVVTTVSFVALFLPFLLGVAHDSWRGVFLPFEASTPPLLQSLPVQLSTKAWYYPLVFQLAQSIHRIFPFARGLFEDKVANIWCAVHASGVHKLHQYDSSLLSRAALGLTSLSILPPCMVIFFKPRKELVPWALATTAWGFFLCSYQVHEKNVLLPLLPMTMLVAGHGGLRPDLRAWIGFANTLACWTMFPLLKRDELRMPYFVLTFLWTYLMGLPPTSLSAYFGEQGIWLSLPVKAMHILFYAAMIGWHFAEAFVQAPANMPDLWVVGNVCVGAVGFGLCYLWCLWHLVAESGILQFGKQADDKQKTL